jgi:SecD/SecF fusion protein
LVDTASILDPDLIETVFDPQVWRDTTHSALTNWYHFVPVSWNSELVLAGTSSHLSSQLIHELALCQELEPHLPSFHQRLTQLPASLQLSSTSIPTLRKTLERDKVHSSLKAASRDFDQAASLLKQLQPRSETGASLHPGGLSPFFSHIQQEAAGPTLVWQSDLIPYFDEKSLSFSTLPPLNEIWLQELSRLTKTWSQYTLKVSSQGVHFHYKEPWTTALRIDLQQWASKQLHHLQHQMIDTWHPTHPDLHDLPILTLSEYATRPPEDTSLCLVIGSHLDLWPDLPFEPGDTLYVGLKGILPILESYESHVSSPLYPLLHQELQALFSHLQLYGFYPTSLPPYPTTTFGNKDLILRSSTWTDTYVQTIQEPFHREATSSYMSLPFGSLKHWIQREDRIGELNHEELLIWHKQAREGLLEGHPLPPPPRNPLISNLMLTLSKWYRGDSKQVLKWGLDLSGGKTVQLELLDQGGQVVVDSSLLQQSVQELHQRLNRMGVADISIKQLGSSVVVDFPGAQDVSAEELIRPSKLQLHVVNETFSPTNLDLKKAVVPFLQLVWDRAVTSGETHPDQIHKIAASILRHEQTTHTFLQELWDRGLRLELDTTDPTLSVSRIALWKEAADLEYPLMVVFDKAALEGKDLVHIRSGYEPSKGHYLSFDISDHQDSDGLSPQDHLFAWTSRFSRQEVAGTPFEAVSQGRGWRMAVLLNDQVISAPHLEASIRESAMITGRFTNQEIGWLASDLQAGSLSFVPRILSEKTMGPELGQQARIQGILATCLALFTVVAAMLLSYRFAGLIASIALIVNMLIIWTILQMIGATLTLAGLAGVVLTLGMAVDANVLVLERVKEELARQVPLSKAIALGYKKAFSAIFDSNLTTLLAAVILLSFQAGPVRSFALNLFIGLTSSMFTALFLTRLYFTFWLNKKPLRTLHMPTFLTNLKLPFLRYTRQVWIAVGSLCLLGALSWWMMPGSLLSIDFTGGYALSLQDPMGDCPKERLEQALVLAGLRHQDISIKTLSQGSELRIFLSPQAAAHLASKVDDSPTSTPSLKPLSYLQHLFKEQKLIPTDASLDQLLSQWTCVSQQFSTSIYRYALIGLGLSFLSIFIYLSFRFEAIFAWAALASLLLDLLLTLSLFSVLAYFKVPVQIDLNSIAAILTVIGYSLNDKIIVFDRVREDLSPTSFTSTSLEGCLHKTFSRTLVTSGTTLLALVSLLIFGGSPLFNFSLIMTLGVSVGTLSSWLASCPLLLIFRHVSIDKSS